MASASTKTQIKLEDIIKQVEGQRYPPVEKWNPDFCGDIDMQIKRDGTWFYMGTPIGRKRMVRLFSTVLRKDEDGKTYLVTPVEKVGIEVEDAHFVATSVEAVGEGTDKAFKFTTNVGDEVIADADHPIRVEVDEATGEPRPYILVRGRLEALIARSVFYELVENAETVTKDGGARLAITSRGTTFSLGDIDDGDM
ncbi:DUF1285 domain-containing protein [Kordiimonas gwangyangensis]|uniref:DUF1285 domain-containing protein n=1 Tax=Kordiimonas gwangyangensis TaxID=288022 RepID=UPI00037DDB80|nr:DUF1285 domain-containing protein [Kordiimonas gwangyangensis]